ncbi:MAG TPA: hypothetical protein HPP77_10625, partial [Candidatus Hydrogenedentes bacterium]|nr:hypothetical protein [Candidatus Hydrogenedentota bacterium]
MLLAGSVVATAALSRIRALDDTVESLEQRLVDLSLLVARNEDVAQAFSAISAQHSSAWTHEEINDRLRHEIDRLARRVPEAPAAEAAPDYLVQIPRLEEAILTEAGSGYREYRIDLDTAPVDLPGVVLFLKRLQESPQALRVDELELRRKPLDTWVTPGIGITRTVVNWPPEDAAPKPEETLPSIGVNLVRNPSFERWDEHAAMPHDWLAQGCRVEQAAEYASEGTWCLRAEAVEAGAAVWQRHA